MVQLVRARACARLVWVRSCVRLLSGDGDGALCVGSGDAPQCDSIQLAPSHPRGIHHARAHHPRRTGRYAPHADVATQPVCAATQTSADDDVLRRFHDEMHDPIAKEVLDRLVTELWARHEAVHDMLRRLDKSGSGCLSKSDLRMGLQSMHLKLTPNELDSVIRLFDKDGSGMVDYVNFYHVLTKYQAEKRHRFAQDVPPLYNRNALDGISNAEVFIRDPALYAKLQSARVCEAQLGRGPRTQAEVIEALVAERVAAETAKLRAELEAKYEAGRLQAELADLKLKVTHSSPSAPPADLSFRSERRAPLHSDSAAPASRFDS